jgi:hypothetical protein
MHALSLAFTISLPLLGVLFFGAVLLAFLLLAWYTPGSGADLVDWNPAGRAEERQILEQEDFGELLEATNRRRRRQGLPELTEHEVLEDLQREDR